MAVIIQEMVNAEYAGVLFSKDPVTGDPSKIVITANFGLGEVWIIITLQSKLVLKKYIF